MGDGRAGRIQRAPSLFSDESRFTEEELDAFRSLYVDAMAYAALAPRINGLLEREVGHVYVRFDDVAACAFEANHACEQAAEKVGIDLSTRKIVVR